MQEEKINKLNDINSIIFSDDIDEIVSSLEIILMMFEVNDDKEIILACKKRLQEGIQILKTKDYKNIGVFKIEK